MFAVTASFSELLVEFEAKVSELAPDALQPSAPATIADLRRAEELHGAELTDEVATLALLHNGCGGYPDIQAHFPLASNVLDLGIMGPFPLSGGPFEERSTVQFAGNGGYSYLVTPLKGDYRGHVFRMSSDGYYSCYAAASIGEVVETWIAYLDAGLLVPVSDGRQIVVGGSNLHVDDGPSTITTALAALPSANPLVLDHLIDEDNDDEFILVASRQAPYGIDGRLDPRDFDHDEWLEEMQERLTDQHNEIPAGLPWTKPA